MDSLFGGNGYNTDNDQQEWWKSPSSDISINEEEEEAYNEDDSEEFEMFPRFGKNNNQQLSYALYDPDSNTRLHFNHGTMRRHKVPPPGADTRYKYETLRRPTYTAKISMEQEVYTPQGGTVRRPFKFHWLGFGPRAKKDSAYFLGATTTWAWGGTTPPPPPPSAAALAAAQSVVDATAAGDGVAGNGKKETPPTPAAAETPERQQLTREEQHRLWYRNHYGRDPTSSAQPTLEERREQRRRWYRNHYGRDAKSSAEIEATLRRLSPKSPVVCRWNGGGQQQQQSAAVLAY
jgi:hypothetical protein